TPRRAVAFSGGPWLPKFAARFLARPREVVGSGQEAQMPGPRQRQLGDEGAFDRPAVLGGALLVVGGAALGRIPVAGAAPSVELEGSSSSRGSRRASRSSPAS